jgi:signal transduction histidine kinase
VEPSLAREDPKYSKGIFLSWQAMFFGSLAVIFALISGREFSRQVPLLLSLLVMVIAWFVLSPKVLRQRSVSGRNGITLLAIEALALLVAVHFNASASYGVVVLAALGYLVMPVRFSIPIVALYEVLLGLISHYWSWPKVSLSVTLAWVIPLAVAGGFSAIAFDRFEQERYALINALHELEKAQARLVELSGAIARRDERERLAARIHESIAQSLIGILLTARSFEDSAPSGERQLILEQAEQALSAARALMSEADDTRGLHAFRDVVELQLEKLSRAGIGVIAEGYDIELDEDKLECLSLVAKECVTNIVRHSKASSVTIRVAKEENMLVMVVADDGIGFKGYEPEGHFGLRLMRRRVEQSGGSLAIQSSGGCGSKVIVRIPV